jgi:hypothetical protein
MSVDPNVLYDGKHLDVRGRPPRQRGVDRPAGLIADGADGVGPGSGRARVTRLGAR